MDYVKIESVNPVRSTHLYLLQMANVVDVERAEIPKLELGQNVECSI